MIHIVILIIILSLVKGDNLPATRHLRTSLKCVSDVQCSIIAPYCSKIISDCVQCLDDSNCKNPDQPFCLQGRCIGCLEDQNCIVSRPFCSSNSCVECIEDSNCADPLLPNCNLTTNKCYGCIKDSDCPIQQMCLKEQSICVECQSDSDCKYPLGSKCNILNRKCYECYTDLDCASDQICDQTSNLCEFISSQPYSFIEPGYYSMNNSFSYNQSAIILKINNEFSNSTYSIMNVATKNYLGITSDYLVEWGSQNQEFAFISTNTGSTYCILHVNSGLYLSMIYEELQISSNCTQSFQINPIQLDTIPNSGNYLIKTSNFQNLAHFNSSSQSIEISSNINIWNFRKTSNHSYSIQNLLTKQYLAHQSNKVTTSSQDEQWVITYSENETKRVRLYNAQLQNYLEFDSVSNNFTVCSIECDSNLMLIPIKIHENITGLNAFSKVISEQTFYLRENLTDITLGYKIGLWKLDSNDFIQSYSDNDRKCFLSINLNSSIMKSELPISRFVIIKNQSESICLLNLQTGKFISTYFDKGVPYLTTYIQCYEPSEFNIIPINITNIGTSQRRLIGFQFYQGEQQNVLKSFNNDTLWNITQENDYFSSIQKISTEEFIGTDGIQIYLSKEYNNSRNNWYFVGNEDLTYCILNSQELVYISFSYNATISNECGMYEKFVVY